MNASFFNPMRRHQNPSLFIKGPNLPIPIKSEKVRPRRMVAAATQPLGGAVSDSACELRNVLGDFEEEHRCTQSLGRGLSCGPSSCHGHGLPLRPQGFYDA